MLTEALVRDLEAKLLNAVLNSDVPVLEALLADDLTFVDQGGSAWGKQDDLGVHRSGILDLEQLDAFEQDVRIRGNTAVVVTGIEIRGEVEGQLFEGAFRYTRVWREDGGRVQVIAAHCTEITEG